MKVTVVPAQVTTVEDRIIGSLGFSQILLLVVPIFVSAGLYVLPPPMMAGSVYKYILMTIATVICLILAIRIRGKILASWLLIILRYNLRPQIYIWNKNTTQLRQDYPDVEPSSELSDEVRETTAVMPDRLPLHVSSKILSALNNPEAGVRYETTKKGGLYVRFTEVENQSVKS
jgi:PrgI family protein